MALTTVVAVAAHALALLSLAATRSHHPLATSSANPSDLVPITLEATPEPAPLPANVVPEPSPGAQAESKARPRTPYQGRTRSPDARAIEEPEPPAVEATLSSGSPAGLGEGPISNAMPSSSSMPISRAMPSASATPDALPPPLVPRAIHAPSAVFGGQIEARNDPPPMSGGGQIVSTVRSAANQGAPANGHGTIRIEVDAAGAVTGVISSSPSWANVARAIQSSLAGRRIRAPSGGRGLAITFAVDADVTTVPPAIAGEMKATPCAREETNKAGGVSRLPEPGCLSVLALLPLPRHRVTVKFLGERPR